MCKMLTQAIDKIYVYLDKIPASLIVCSRIVGWILLILTGVYLSWVRHAS